jgi:hypothetical protein
VSHTVPDGAHRLAALARAAGTTSYAYFLAVAGWALGQAMSSDGIVAGVPMSSRESVGADGELGCFANLAPVNLPLRGDTAQLVTEASTALLAAMDHGLLPFPEIARLTGLPRDGWGAASVGFVCQLEQMPTPTTVEGTTVTLRLLANPRPLYPICLRGETSDGALWLHLDTNLVSLHAEPAMRVLQRIAMVIGTGRWE